MKAEITFERVINDENLSGYFLTRQAKETFYKVCEIVEEDEDYICDIVEREFEDLDEWADYLHHEDAEEIARYLGLTIIEQDEE